LLSPRFAFWSRCRSALGLVLAGIPTTGGHSQQPARAIDSNQPGVMLSLPSGMSVEMIRAGDSVFHDGGRCFACHGAEGEGLPSAGNGLTLGLSLVQPEWDLIDSVITSGIPDRDTRAPIAMPARGARGNLTDEQIRAVAAYVWAISRMRGEPWNGGHTYHPVPPGSTSGTSPSALVGIPARPVTLLGSAGAGSAQLSRLGKLLIALGSAVTLLVTGAILFFLPNRRKVAPRSIPEAGGEHRGILFATLVTLVVLAGVLIATVASIHTATGSPMNPALTIEIVGHRWWWEVRYLAADQTIRAITANELHIPTGQPVALRVSSADVIHSFWIPELQGKIDLIPGKQNRFWLEADRPGAYRGQCAEYCGTQHAHMAAYVIAEEPARFAVWLDHQARIAQPPSTPLAAAGAAAFSRAGCAGCHTVRGTPAAGTAGPDLTHLAGRFTIAAGTLPNIRGNLAAWTTDAPSLKPGTLMPAIPLQTADWFAILEYLEGLN
jgi:cytochrome c oxidase subunit 2